MVEGEVSMRRSNNRLFLSAAILLFSVFAIAGPPEDESNDADYLISKWNMSAEEITSLENQVKKNPSDLAAREKLLIHYGTERLSSPEARKLFAKHALWVINNFPASKMAVYECALDPRIDGKAYEKGKKLWLRHVKRNPADASILGNAARALTLYERTTSEELFLRCKKLEPANPKWPEELAHLYRLGRQTEKDDAGSTRNRNAKALALLEEAYALAKTNDEYRFPLLNDLAKCAFEADEIEKAGTYARLLLKNAQKDMKNWNYGNALYDGNLVLGRIALREGKMDEAKSFLLKASESPGSPNLDTFGPNLTLAKELLEKGEKKVVLEFLGKCSSFWKEANCFMEAINKGETPNWGPNLYY